ncbi:Uncharacterised protein [Weeksella virosa]|uniref:Transcriptional regulator n=3 Tax=Weeksella virosa TaxID=1014 RepID=F0NXN9_WEEVC|nr:transcriptional regulator [Weeksella virosa DSM 16922]VEH63325.1 Uncharacterised protein [Weeksella virosa]
MVVTELKSNFVQNFIMSTIDTDQLISDIENFFEHNNGYPPLTAKIFTYMLVEVGQKGITFEELVDKFKASKSSISCSLKYLIEIDKVDFVYKEDKRKRYFRPNPYHFTNRLQEVLDQLEKTMISFDKVQLYRIQKGICKSNYEEVYLIIKKYMELQQNLINDTIEQLNKYKI